MTDEIAKLLSHEWRWRHLFRIRTDEGIVKIKQRQDQLELAKILYPAFFNKERTNVVILKNRQRGTSTWCALFCLDCTAYYPGKVANTIADTQPRASAIFDNVVKLAWDRIPDGLKPAAKKDNEKSLDFSSSIGSKYIISATKSEPADILHISEAPYFPDEDRISEAEQMVRKSGITIMESTAYGMGNRFEDTFMTAWKAKKENKHHHWQALFFPWYTDPTNRVKVQKGMELVNRAFIEEITGKYGLDEEQRFFYDQKMQDLDEEVFQFYPSEPEEAFLHSGRPVFNQEVVKALREKHERSPIRVTEDGIQIWEEPENGRHYGIGVDTAEGLAHGDNSVISVVCKETGREVAQASGKISAIDENDLARVLSLVGRMYRDHLCVIERNNHGHALIGFVKDDAALNLYQQEEKDAITQKVTRKIGWDTGHKSKAYVIGVLKRDLKDGACIPRSPETYDELRTYIHGERGIMGAMPGKKDDRVIALSLANLACREMILLNSLSASDLGFY